MNNLLPEFFKLFFIERHVELIGKCGSIQIKVYITPHDFTNWW